MIINIKNRKNRSILLFSSILILGFLLRIIPVAFNDFPLNDGGLFYVMIGDLGNNEFSIPRYSSYNDGKIPFIYPPFAFYFIGLIEKYLGIDKIILLQYLPALISILIILIFFKFASEIFNDTTEILSSAFAFTFYPMSFVWLIMGGGITRSLGALFSILALWQILLLYKTKNQKYIFSSILFTSFCVLSHPETSYFLIYSSLIFTQFCKERRKNLSFLILILISSFIMLSPWWIKLISYHGVYLFTPLFDNGFTHAQSLVDFLMLKLSNEPFVPFLGIFSIAGIIISVIEKKYLFPVWLALIYIFQSRAADQRAIIPLSLLVGITVGKISKYLQNFQEIERRKNLIKIFTILYICIYIIASSIAIIIMVNKPLSITDRKAMEWIRINTPGPSKFVIISNNDWTLDTISEWFPALSNRTNLNGVQGYEWLPHFSNRITQYKELQTCYYLRFDCIQSWEEKFNVKNIDYIYLKRKLVSNSNHYEQSPLELSLNLKNDFTVVYQDTDLVIWEYVR